jgi:hypothetical protein
MRKLREVGSIGWYFFGLPDFDQRRRKRYIVVWQALAAAHTAPQGYIYVLPDSRSRPSHGSASRSANGAEFSLNTTGPPIQRESEWATTSAKLVKNCRGHSLHQTIGVFNLAENGTIYGYQNMGVYFSF